MKLERAKLDALTCDPANVRKHDQRNLDAIKGSLQRFGQQHPIIVDGDGIIRAGNGRFMAMRALGWSECDIVRTALKGAEATAFAIADNRTAELATWDDEALAQQLAALQIEDEELALATGYDEKEIAALALDSVEVEEDEIPEPPADPITKPGDLWLLGDHRLLCGDSTKSEDVARLMDGAKTDLCFTSPPYGVGVDYGATYEDSIGNVRSMLPKLAKLLDATIADDGFAVVNFGDIAPASDIVGTQRPCEYPMALEYWPAFRDAGWRLWSRRIWCKPNPRVHSLQCIGSNRAATDWEHIWTWTRAEKPRVSRVDGDYRSCLGWRDSSAMQGVDIGKNEHGAGMSVGIAVWMLSVHSLSGDVVIEPFCGTGTTLIAAEQLGRKCYGMEISPAYCDVIVKRWEALTGKQAQRA